MMKRKSSQFWLFMTCVISLTLSLSPNVRANNDITVSTPAENSEYQTGETLVN